MIVVLVVVVVLGSICAMQVKLECTQEYNGGGGGGGGGGGVNVLLRQ
jgi:hypothetical protein